MGYAYEGEKLFFCGQESKNLRNALHEALDAFAQVPVVWHETDAGVDLIITFVVTLGVLRRETLLEANFLQEVLDLDLLTLLTSSLQLPDRTTGLPGGDSFIVTCIQLLDRGEIEFTSNELCKK